MYCEDCVEVLYEYDVREMWLDWRKEWDQSRKDLFLVRQDIVKPLSADGWGGWKSFDDLIEDMDFLDTLTDLSRIKKFLKDTWKNKKPCWLVAITELSEEPYYSPIEDQFDPEWKLLGYDICAGPSFLMNAGWREDEVELKNHLRLLLNEYHLFPDLETAKANWQSIHDREPPHGPFTINGLYLIEEINPEK